MEVLELPEPLCERRLGGILSRSMAETEVGDVKETLCDRRRGVGSGGSTGAVAETEGGCAEVSGGVNEIEEGGLQRMDDIV
jgi:hypothetical protein